MSRRGLQLVEATIVDHVARIASGLESPDSVDLSMLSGHYTEAVRLVGSGSGRLRMESSCAPSATSAGARSLLGGITFILFALTTLRFLIL